MSQPVSAVPSPTTTTTTTPARSPKYFWEDFPVGREIPIGPMQVEREAVLAFAQDFDPQPFHLDDAAAEASLFGRLAASGWHTGSMAMRMMCDAYILDTAGLGSPGIDNLKWLHPVYPGDTLRGKVSVKDARPMKSKPHVGLIYTALELVNQDGRPVMTLESWGMVRRREVAETPVQPAA